MSDNPAELEKDLRELESLIAKMESGDTTLDQALNQFEQGVQLVKRCQGALQQAEQKVRILIDNHLQDFEDDTNNA